MPTAVDDLKKLSFPVSERLIKDHGADPACALVGACLDGEITLIAWLIDIHKAKIDELAGDLGDVEKHAKDCREKQAKGEDVKALVAKIK